MEEVKPISAAYYALGRALRLHPGDLDRIRQENCQNTQQALNEVLLLWLRQSYDVKKHGPPTWEMLVEAVSKDTGGNNKALAKRIATNKNIITQAAL